MVPWLYNLNTWKLYDNSIQYDNKNIHVISFEYILTGGKVDGLYPCL